MNWHDTNLVFSPPPWPALLLVAAGALVLWELGHLLWDLWRGRAWGQAFGMTLALAGGPVTALAAAIFAAGGSTGGPSPGRRVLAGAALRFTFVAAMVLAMVRWPLLGAIGAITVCAILWTLRAYGRTTSNIRTAWKVVLLTLRMAAVLLLGLWLTNPQLEYPTQEKVRRAVLIGIDLSSSMQRRDVHGIKGLGAAETPPPISRIESVRAALDGAAADIDKLAAEADVRLFGFAAGQRTLGELDGKQEFTLHLPDANGAATAIGDATQAAVDLVLKRGGELAGVVLITDGCNNTSDPVTPDKLASRLATTAVPVHTVGVGSEKVSPATKNLSVTELVAPDQVEAFNRMLVRARVDAFGLKGRPVRVSYRFGNDANTQAGGADPNSVQVFTVTDEQQSLTVEFVHVPLASGFHRLTVRAECVNPPEGLGGQFTADKLVQVVDRGLRILYLEGLYRYEIKFLTQALAAAGRFSIDRRIMLQPLRPDAPSPLGENLEDWLRYHAIILGDLPADYLTPKQQAIIKDLVSTYGKGLCMIGGTKSFGRGGWERTPIADVMPVDLKASNEQIEREIHVVPTADGLLDPMMAIGKDGQNTAAAWKELSVLPGANKLAGVKPGAAVLAATEQGEPLVVSQRFGAGRSLAIAFDTTWLWVTTKDTGELQRRFWRQVALYLCDPKGNVWVTTDKPRYDLARLREQRELVEVSGGVEDPQGSPMPGAPVKLTLTGPDGASRPLTLAAEGHRRVAKLSAVQLGGPGTYTLKLEADVAGKPMSAETRFDVQERNLEALDVLANFKLLQRVSETTRGRFVELDDLRALLDELRQGDAQPKYVRQIKAFDLGGYCRWPVIVILISLLCIEWAIRKRKGLV